MAENKAFPFALPFVLDGATGTELTKRGMPQNACTERYVMENPEVIQQLQREYLAAGSDAILAPTFGANRPTLERHGYAPDEVEAAVRALYKIAKDNAGTAKVGGDMSPTGLLLKPYGDAEPERVFEIYREQAKTLLDCGVDFFFIETMISAAEAKLAVRAVRDLSKDVPVFVSLTVNENGRTINGDCLDAVLISLLPYDIQAFGCNCSIGPDVIARALAPAAPIAKRYGIPLIAKPNAGMPVTDKDGTHFPLSPEDMAAAVEHLTALGVGVFGGCCGTTPAHVGAIAKAARSLGKPRFGGVEAVEDALYVSTARAWAKVEDGAEYVFVDADSEDDLYDLTDELDPSEVMYLDLGPGAADVIVRMEGFLPNPIAARGDESEIQKVENQLCRKVR